ncbi:MAG: hypothetical protein WKG01_01870 [Kofleriaceae bacterium]
MSKKLELLKKIVEKRGVSAPDLSAGSSKERAWPPPYVVPHKD